MHHPWGRHVKSQASYSIYAKSLQSEGYMPIAGKKQIKDFAEKALQSKGWRPIAGRKTTRI